MDVGFPFLLTLVERELGFETRIMTAIRVAVNKKYDPWSTTTTKARPTGRSSLARAEVTHRAAGGAQRARRNLHR